MAKVATFSDTLPFNILTDLAQPQQWLDQLEQARVLTPALDEVLTYIERKQITNESGAIVTVPDNVLTVEQAALLFYLIETTKPTLSVETGFTYGLAASVMTLAHMRNDQNGGHVPIQENAKQIHDGIGFYLLQKLGLRGFQLMEHEPAIVLPQLYMQQLNNGLTLVYLNSAEDADEQVMEYFYLIRLLNEGGIMAINTNHPARQKLVDFIRTDRDDFAVLALPCGITLIQKPNVTALSRTAGIRH